MKKAMKIAAWLLAIGLVIFLIGVIAMGGDFRKASTVKVEKRQQRIEEEFSEIFIDVEAGDVRIQPALDNLCKADVAEYEKCGYEISVEEGVLKIIERDARKWYECIGLFVEGMKCTLSLPQDAYQTLTVGVDSGDITVASGLTFADVKLTNSSGEIEMRAKATNTLTVAASSGDIEISGGTMSALIAKSASGDIEIDNLSASGNISVSSSSGDIELTGVRAGSLTAKNSSGSVKLDDVISQGKTDVQTSSGSVKFTRCDGESFAVRTSSGGVNGTVLTTKRFVARSSSGNINVPTHTEGGLFEVETSSGNIRLSVVGG